MVGGPTIQTSVNFGNFVELYLRSKSQGYLRSSYSLEFKTWRTVLQAPIVYTKKNDKCLLEFKKLESLFSRDIKHL